MKKCKDCTHKHFTRCCYDVVKPVGYWQDGEFGWIYTVIYERPPVEDETPACHHFEGNKDYHERYRHVV
jgi:hypothetical protein